MNKPTLFLKVWKPGRIPFANIRKKKQKKYLGMGEKSTVASENKNLWPDFQ